MLKDYELTLITSFSNTKEAPYLSPFKSEENGESQVVESGNSPHRVRIPHLSFLLLQKGPNYLSKKKKNPSSQSIFC